MTYSNYLESKLLHHFFGHVDFTPATVLYLALCTGEPTETGIGYEPIGGSYTRKPIHNVKLSVSGWSAPILYSSGYRVNNYAQITFAEATADWGLITHFALFDALTNGNMYGYTSMTIPKFIESGDIPQFPSGSVRVALF